MKLVLAILVQMTAVTVGDLLLAKGVRLLGPIPVTSIASIFIYLGKALSSAYVVTGIVFLALSFFTWIAVLSRADLSFALPLTAIGYVLNAFAARLVLHEHISPVRWLGTLVICLGVLIISRSVKS